MEKKCRMGGTLVSSCPEWAGTSVMGMDAHCVRTTYVSFSEGKCESYAVRRPKKFTRAQRT